MKLIVILKKREIEGEILAARGWSLEELERAIVPRLRAGPLSGTRQRSRRMSQFNPRTG
jgi:hypothetical protein